MNILETLSPPPWSAAKRRPIFAPLQRHLEPEWLDHLPADDPRALGSRRDLHRLNAVMGHARLAACALRAIFGRLASGTLVDLGAGDGRFLLQVARRLSGIWRGAKIALVDSRPAVTPETLSELAGSGFQAQVHQAEVFDWLKGPFAVPGQIFVANLFLHHFSDNQLVELFSLCARQGQAFVALEPRRSLRAALFSRLCGLIGCNAVTRHDAPASVAAGFSENELSRLWPKDSGWHLDEGPASLFTHQFIAVRGSGSWLQPAHLSLPTDNVIT
jgi:hypothetical protein